MIRAVIGLASRFEYQDYDQVLRAVAYFTHKYGKIDCFESHTEYWLEQDARIRTDFNIPGITSAMIGEMKHKSLMNQKFVDAGVAVAPGKVIRTAAEALTFVTETGYPVVAKPDNGVGAAATYKLLNEEEVESFFRHKPPVDYFFEGFITGELYSFDGLTDRDGNVVFYTVHHYSRGIMEIVNQDLDMYYYSLRDIPPVLEQAGMATVQAFAVRFDAIISRKYHCAYVGRKNNKRYRHSHDEILARWGHVIVYHEPVVSIFSAALGNYGYVTRAENWPDLQEFIEFAHAKQE